MVVGSFSSDPYSSANVMVVVSSSPDPYPSVNRMVVVSSSPELYPSVNRIIWDVYPFTTRVICCCQTKR